MLVYLWKEVIVNILIHYLTSGNHSSKYVFILSITFPCIFWTLATILTILLFSLVDACKLSASSLFLAVSSIFFSKNFLFLSLKFFSFCSQFFNFWNCSEKCDSYSETCIYWRLDKQNPSLFQISSEVFFYLVLIHFEIEQLLYRHILNKNWFGLDRICLTFKREMKLTDKIRDFFLNWCLLKKSQIWNNIFCFTIHCTISGSFKYMKIQILFSPPFS